MSGFSIVGLLNNPLYIDVLIKNWIMKLKSPLFDQIFGLITNLGSPGIIIVLLILTITLLWVKNLRWEGLFMLACVISAWKLMDYIKLLIKRERPLGEALAVASGYSFPSGHAMVSMAFYGFAAYLVLVNIKGDNAKIVASLLGFLIFMIGLSRIYLNVHYASDVLAGFGLGIVLLLLFIYGLKRAKENFSKI